MFRMPPRSTPIAPGRRSLLFALLLLAALACGCRGPAAAPVAHLGATSTAPAAAAQRDEMTLSYTGCLRAHGLDEPDPTHRAGHAGLSIVVPARTAANAPALDACARDIAPLVASKQATMAKLLPTLLPALTSYAGCMRAHGMPVLDPRADGALDTGPVRGVNGPEDPDAAPFRAAHQVCRHLLPKAFSAPWGYR